jgi:trimethylamine--corrinoid protein Co-methyltransferase
MNGVLRGQKLRFLTKREIETIHSATLEILRTVGIKVFSDKILKIFTEAGAETNSESKIVKIPEYLIKEALKKAPKKFILYGRNPKYNIIVDNKRIYFGLGGTPTPYFLDLESGEFRRPTKKDVAEVTRLGDALENISFIMTIAGAYDVPYEVQYLHEYEAIFNNTEKPIVYPAPGAEIAQYALSMASAVAGGEDELREKPFICLYSEPPPPLMMAETDENLIEYANHGVPIALGPTSMAGSTGPVTLAGAAVVSNAQSLAALTLIQTVNPSNPVFYACWVAATDPRTGRHAYGSPEFAFSTSVINSQMARYYELPCFGFAGCPDSNFPDAQAGAEAMMMTLMNTLSGVNLMHDCGYIAGGDAGSMEMAVICNEICGIALKIAKGIEVNDKTLALDVIREVGPGGHFLSHKHTLKFLESGEIYIPKLFNRISKEAWIKAGKKQIYEVARDVVRKILKEHSPKPLSPDVQQKLREIIKNAERKKITR